ITSNAHGYQIYNNIFDFKGSAIAVMLGTASTIEYSNYNDFYVGGTVGFPVAGGNLSSWRAAGYDINSLTTDPLFVNIDDPDGPDDIYWTEDDGLRIIGSSPLVGAGRDKDYIGAMAPLTTSGNNPIANISLDKSSGYENLQVKLDASNSLSGSGSITNYEWNFGDGTTATGALIGHTFHSGEYTITLKVTNSSGYSNTAQRKITVYPALEPDLILYLNFDNNIQDSSGRNHTVSWTDENKTKTFTEGKKGQAVWFDGTANSSYVTVDKKVPDLDNMEQLTISLWAKKNIADLKDNRAELIRKFGVYGIGIRYTGSFVYTYIGTENAYMGLGTDAPGMNNTLWHHYALTYDGSKAILYFDGKQNSAKDLNGTITTASYNVGVGGGFNGAIDELKLYDRALSASEIQNLYNLAVPMPTPCHDLTNDGKINIFDLVFIALRLGNAAGDPAD
ncbi:PKD domain-containing protein, partial [Candidatus Falkowbacteria bacterium]|nr:PKD domain-containing protein [Candidatus Falkowbacteria bacterium]